VTNAVRGNGEPRGIVVHKKPGLIVFVWSMLVITISLNGPIELGKRAGLEVPIECGDIELIDLPPTQEDDEEEVSPPAYQEEIIAPPAAANPFDDPFNASKQSLPVVPRNAAQRLSRLDQQSTARLVLPVPAATENRGSSFRRLTGRPVVTPAAAGLSRSNQERQQEAAVAVPSAAENPSAQEAARGESLPIDNEYPLAPPPSVATNPILTIHEILQQGPPGRPAAKTPEPHAMPGFSHEALHIAADHPLPRSGNSQGETTLAASDSRSNSIQETPLELVGPANEYPFPAEESVLAANRQSNSVQEVPPELVRKVTERPILTGEAVSVTTDRRPKWIQEAHPGLVRPATNHPIPRAESQRRNIVRPFAENPRPTSMEILEKAAARRAVDPPSPASMEILQGADVWPEGRTRSTRKNMQYEAESANRGAELLLIPEDMEQAPAAAAPSLPSLEFLENADAWPGGQARERRQSLQLQAVQQTAVYRRGPLLCGSSEVLEEGMVQSMDAVERWLPNVVEPSWIRNALHNAARGVGPGERIDKISAKIRSGFERGPRE
jgi:hypothetical protein